MPDPDCSFGVIGSLKNVVDSSRMWDTVNDIFVGVRTYMEKQELLTYWQQEFAGCPPVSYLFRDRLSDRWFRFHSLPESKRYADDEAETIELLARQNQVLLDVIGDGEECILMYGVYDDERTGTAKSRYDDCPELKQFNFREFLKLSTQEFEQLDEENDAVDLYLFYDQCLLRRGALDGLLQCVADERLVRFIVLSTEQNRIFAPYDGGVDVILSDSDERGEFKAKYKSWLSSRADGL